MLMPMRLTIFLCFHDTNVASNSVSAELDMYINDTSHDIDSLHRFSLVKKVFIAKNTALPSSAPVERLSSIEGMGSLMIISKNSYSSGES